MNIKIFQGSLLLKLMEFKITKSLNIYYTFYIFLI